MADVYIVIRGLNESENGRWYNVTQMERMREYALLFTARRDSMRPMPDADEPCFLTGSSVSLAPTGVLEFAQYGGVAEVYRPCSD